MDVKRVLPGHHRLDIPATRIGEVEAAFRQLDRDGKLKQGGGIFDFCSFQIHI